MESSIYRRTQIGLLIIGIDLLAAAILLPLLWRADATGWAIRAAALLGLAVLLGL